MKNLYYRRRSPLLSTPGRVGTAIVIIVVLALFALRFAAPGAFFAAAAPVFSAGSMLGASGGFLFSGFEDAATLSLEVARLKRENAALANTNSSLQARLEDYAHLAGTGEIEGVIAGVIARPPLAPYDVLIVNVAEGAEVAQGARVSAQGGVPIGSVETVAGGFAHVSLFSSPGKITDAWAGEERLPLTLTGKGAGAFSAEIARDAAIAVGDFIYAAGPGARPIGTVLRIDTNPSSPSATLMIEPLVNPFMLPYVLIEYPS